MDRTVLLSIDALRADRLSEAFFPTCWDAFESEFCRFTAAYSHGTATPLAFPGLVAGETATGAGVLPGTATTLAELHDGLTIAETNNLHLSRERGYARGVDRYDAASDDVSLLARAGAVAERSGLFGPAYERLADAVPGVTRTRPDLPYAPAEAMAATLRDAIDRSPQFLWGHFMDAHTPHRPRGVTDADVEVAYDGAFEELNEAFHDKDATEPQLAVLEELYDAHVRYLDRQLARVLRRLEATGWWDDALVVIVGDHGEAFGEKGQQVHTWEGDPIEEVIHTPLLVKYPDGEHAGETYDHVVQHADVHATVAAHVGVPVDSRGVELTDDRARLVPSKSNASVRITTEAGWYVVRRDGTATGAGDVPERVRAAAEAEPYPEVELLSGEAPGVGDGGNVEERLEALGYR